VKKRTRLCLPVSPTPWKLNNSRLFAGHDTTSHAVSWAIWALATHPEIQERLYREIIDTFGESDAEFATAKIKDLKYLDAFLKVSFFGGVWYFNLLSKLTHNYRKFSESAPQSLLFSV
jgi:hypothetical protein